jgi:hypothetical protein
MVLGGLAPIFRNHKIAKIFTIGKTPLDRSLCEIIFRRRKQGFESGLQYPCQHFRLNINRPLAKIS